MPKPKRVSRRQFMMSASVLAGSLVALPASATSFNNPSYSEVESSIWYLAEVDSVDPIAVLQALVRYATLAPSSHNTQCWQFAIETASTSQENHTITIMPDLARRCPSVDPDDHHLFVSLGCALENLCQAAAAHGLQAEYVFDESDGNRIRVMLQAMPELRSALFYAIPKRQCTRSEYDGLAIAH